LTQTSRTLPPEDALLPNRIFKLRIVVFAAVALLLVLLAYLYGAKAL
jgi:hypothetical protein